MSELMLTVLNVENVRVYLHSGIFWFQLARQAFTVVRLYTGNGSVRVWSGGMGFSLFMVSIVMMRTGRFSRTTLLCE